MTAPDDAELARLQAEAEAAEAALKLAQAKAALAAAQAESERLLEELAAIKAKNAEISIKHEVACSTINLIQKKCNVRGEALNDS